MNDKPEEVKTEQNPPVNEVGGFYFSTAIKIFDPDTDEILVQQRGDN